MLEETTGTESGHWEGSKYENYATNHYNEEEEVDLQYSHPVHSQDHSDETQISSLKSQTSKEPLKEESTTPMTLKEKLTNKLIEAKQVLLTKAFLQTMLLNYAVLCMCVGSSSIGPLINAFSKQTDTPRKTLGIIFTIRGVGSLITTILGGFIMDALKKFFSKKIKDDAKRNLYQTLTIYALLILSILTIVFATVVMPFCSSFWSISIFFFIWGVGSGYLGLCAQALLFSIWEAMKVNVTPFSQLFHFSAGIGLFFGPFTVLIINNIFGISNADAEVVEDVPEDISEGLTSLNSVMGNITTGNSTNNYGFIEGTSISLSVVGTNIVICCFFFSSILLFLIYMAYMWVKRNEARDESNRIMLEELHKEEDEGRQSIDLASIESIESVEKKASPQPTDSFSIKLIATILVSLALASYCSAEGTYGNVIYSYMTQTKLADDSNANLLNSGFWLLFTIGRGVAIPISYFVKPYIMLVIDMVGVTIAVALMWIFSMNASVVWVASLLFGLSIASLYPTTISIPSADMGLEITGIMTSLMVLGGSGGGMIGPYITLAIFESVGPKALFGTTTVNMLCLALLFALMFAYGIALKRMRNKKNQTLQAVNDGDVSPIELK